MPLYEYHCEACGSRFEVIRKFSDPVLDVCTSCGKGPVQRLQSSPAIQFKGTGWYITDYAQKGKSSGKPDSGGELADPTLNSTVTNAWKTGGLNGPFDLTRAQCGPAASGPTFRYRWYASVHAAPVTFDPPGTRFVPVHEAPAYTSTV